MHGELLLLSRPVRYSERQAGGQAGWTASLGGATMGTRVCFIGSKVLLSAAVLALGCATNGAQAASDATQSFITAANLACLVLGMKQDRSIKCMVNYQDSRPVLQITFEASDRNRVQE